MTGAEFGRTVPVATFVTPLSTITEPERFLMPVAFMEKVVPEVRVSPLIVTVLVAPFKVIAAPARDTWVPRGH